MEKTYTEGSATKYLHRPIANSRSNDGSHTQNGNSHLTTDDFEMVKRRYNQLSEAFNMRAGYYEHCVNILRNFVMAEERICEIESKSYLSSSVFQVVVGEARKMLEDCIFSSSVRNIQRQLDEIDDLLSEIIYDDPKPALPDFDPVNQMCTIENIVGMHLEIEKIEEQKLKELIESAISQAGISETAINVLTNNKSMHQVLLVSTPVKQTG